MRSPSNELPVRQALALGLLQGPAELLPISSSAHTSAIPWLLGWRYTELDPELRNSFEVAVHAGSTAALLGSLRGRIFEGLDRRSVLVIALACAPPALAGYALERKIESRLSTPATIAAGLLAGSAAMTLADRAPGRRRSRDAGVRDGLWLGVAQSAALFPGISRAGATTSAARLLGFGRDDAIWLSERVGLPVLVGAALLKAIRLAERGLERERAPAFAAGVAGSFASTLAIAALPHNRRRSQRLLPYAVYRAALASWMLSRIRRGSTASPPRTGSNAHHQGHTGSVW
jgi:undecaprenyl-diphosphatase